MPDPLLFYTDGSSDKDGYGGWAVVVPGAADDDHLCGHASDTTNNRMELTAVLEAMLLAGPAPAVIVSDSQYVRGGLTQWWKGWVRNGWRNASGKPVANQDLWQKLLPVYHEGLFEIRWVKGHAGNEWNEVADKLAGHMRLVARGEA